MKEIEGFQIQFQADLQDFLNNGLNSLSVLNCRSYGLI